MKNQICECGHDESPHYENGCYACDSFDNTCKKFEAVHDNPKCGFGEMCNNCEKELKGWIKEWTKNEKKTKRLWEINSC